MTRATAREGPSAATTLRVAPLSIVAVVSVLVIVREVIQLVGHPDKLSFVEDDFRFYWDAAARFRADPHSLYLPASQMDLRGFLYPPPAIALFMPFCALPHAWAGVTFRIAGILAMLASVWVFADLCEAHGLSVRPRDRAALGIVALAFGPMFTNAFYGQVNSFILLDCLLFRWLLERKRPTLAGVVLAAGIWLKVYPVIVLAFVAVWEWRQFDIGRVILGVVGGAAGIVIVCMPFVPLSLYGTFFTDIMPAASGRTFQNILNQSLVGAASRIGPAADFLGWDKCPHSIVPALWARALNALVALGAFAAFGWSKRPKLVAFFCLLAAIPIVSPLGWAYVYVLAAPVVLYLVLAAPPTLGGNVLALLVCAALFIPATHEVPAVGRLPDLLQHLFYDRYLWVTAFAVGVAAFWRELDARWVAAEGVARREA